MNSFSDAQVNMFHRLAEQVQRKWSLFQIKLDFLASAANAFPAVPHGVARARENISSFVWNPVKGLGRTVCKEKIHHTHSARFLLTTTAARRHLQATIPFFENVSTMLSAFF